MLFKILNDRMFYIWLDQEFFSFEMKCRWSYSITSSITTNLDDRNKIMTQITIIPNKGNKMNLPKNGKRLVGGVKRSRVSKDLYQPKRLDTCQVKIDSLFFKFFHLLLLFMQRWLAKVIVAQTFCIRP